MKDNKTARKASVKKPWNTRAKTLRTPTDRTSYILDQCDDFAYVEAYNHLRTNVMFALAAAGTEKKTIVVSSANAAECKSTLSANLAISLAKLQHKVLIIDADMRKPRLHRVFGIRNECGLSDVLLNSPAGRAIVGVNGLNLDFLPAGTLPPNPSELLASAAFSDLLSQLEKIYDYIIVDTPPLLVVSDALMLSEVSAGILLACRYRRTSFKDINRVLSTLNFAKFNVLGAVIVGSKNSYSSVKMRYSYGDGVRKA